MELVIIYAMLIYVHMGWAMVERSDCGAHGTARD